MHGAWVRSLLSCLLGFGLAWTFAFQPARLAPAQTAVAAPRELTDLAELRAAFNADRGLPRVVLLLSPT